MTATRAERIAAAPRETISCACRVCDGRSATAPVGLVVGTPKQRRDLAHSYVSAAHSPSPLGQVMSQRAGVEAVAA